MHLVEILLPISDNQGRVFPPERFDALVGELSKFFGGVTAHSRAPAEGQWSEKGETVHDEIVIIEVMADTLDRGWWTALRLRLERDFAQDEVMIRAHEIERL
jgi:hypothetical protein